MRVKFLPKKSIEVEICDIYEDRDALIVQHTDTFQSNTGFNVEALGFKFGIKPTAFHWPYSALQEGLTDIYKTGVVKFGVYVPTDRFRTGSRSGYLPDYTSDTITQAGVDYYGDHLTIGQVKPYRPNQGQDLYNISNGNVGYDVINGVAGGDGNMGFINEMNYIDDWFYNLFGRLPSVGSDRQGVIGSKEIYMPHYLGIRSTSPNNNVDYYDIDRLEFIHRKISSRWEFAFMNDDFDGYNNALIDSVNKAFTEKGLFNDFVHWHRALSYGNIHWLHDLYELIHTTVDDRNAWYCGYDEAVEYYWNRKMTKRVRGSFINGKLHLVADFEDEYKDDIISGIAKKLDTRRIHQPLSVKIDLSGTEFDGKDIKGAKIISLGYNQYIIDIPFNKTAMGFNSVILENTLTPEYKDFTKPTIVSNEGGLVTTNIPTKAVIFSGNFNETMSSVDRSNEFSLVHDFSGKSYEYIGIISDTGISSLIEQS